MQPIPTGNAGGCPWDAPNEGRLHRSIRWVALVTAGLCGLLIAHTVGVLRSTGLSNFSVYSPGTAPYPAKQCFDLSKERMFVLALLKTAARAEEQIERELARLRIVKDDTCNHDSRSV